MSDSSDLPEFSTPYLNNYLRMVEETESPRLFHVWQAIFNVSAALGRRCWFPFGPTNIYPNHYVLIVGTPGTRKSTVATIGKRILKSTTGVRFAPQDTAGQRQGLVAAMQNNTEQKEFLEGAELAGNQARELTLNDIMQVTNDPQEAEAQFIAEADRHHLVAISGEFGRFIGQNNLQMLDFLAGMWDGEDYDYRLKTSEVTLKDPLLNVLGCTTPTGIAHSMPPAAGGQGFLSRVILVYGNRKHKLVPRPATPPAALVDAVSNRLHSIYYNLNGAFDESPEAREFSEKLYSYQLDISDSRFGYYAERRYTHLIKLAMVLCAARTDDMRIEVCDFDEAHRILRATERGMPDALGEFGMNPLAIVKQEILEELRNALGPVNMNQLIAMFTRDAKASDIAEVLNDLRRANHVTVVRAADGQVYASANFKKTHTESGMLSILKKENKTSGD